MSLGLFLRQRCDQILGIWEAEARLAASRSARERAALADDMPQLIEDFAQLLDGEPRALDALAKDCAAAALEHGHPLSQVVHELGLFRRCLLRSWRSEDASAAQSDAEDAAFAVDRVAERAVDLYSEMHTHVLEAFESIAASALSTVGVEEFLRQLLGTFARLMPTVDELAILLRDGDRLVVRGVIGPRAIESLGSSIGVGEGFAGAVASSKRPMASLRGADEAPAESLPFFVPSTRGLYGVPLLDDDQIVGVALAGSTLKDDLPVLAKRLYALVALRATAGVVRRRARADAVRRAAEIDAFIDAIPSPVYLGTAERFLKVNRAGLAAFGIASQDELAQLSVADVLARAELRDPSTGTPVPPEGSAFMRALRGERVAEDFLARDQRTGEERCFRSVSGPVFVEGQVSGAVLVTSDITEIKRAEELFRTIFERVPMAMAQSDPRTGKVVRANAKLCELTGYSMEDLVGRSFAEWTHPDDREKNLEEYLRMTRGETDVYTIEKRYVRKDGSERWVHVTANLLPSPGEPTRTLATIEDITARKRAELEREEILAREHAAGERLRILAAITHSFSEARLDLDRLLAVIPRELTKQLAEACVVHLVSEDGRSLEPVSLCHVDPSAEPLLRRVLGASAPMGEGLSGRVAATGQTIVVGDLERGRITSARFREFNERFRTRGLLSTPLRAFGRVLGTLTIARHAATREHSAPFTDEDRLLVEDLADRAALAIDSARLLVREHAARSEAERAQEELRRTAEFRERLIGIVSHDLRNPLSAIITSATFLAHAEDLPDRLAKSVARIGSAGDRMRRITDELLDFTRGRLGGGIPIEPHPTNVAAIARRVIDELELAHPSRQLVLEASGRLEGNCDETRLAQVVSNLVGNALEHSPPDAPVTVALADRGESEMVLEVRNAGAPIPADLLPHIFDPFRRGAVDRAASGHLGLGLFIAAEIVRAHGGTIQVESTAEAGTTFRVVLPRPSASRPA